MLEVRHKESYLKYKGHVLAVILLGIAASVVGVAVMNLLRGQYQYNISNATFLALVIGLFFLNRRGQVTAAAILTSSLIVLGSVVLLTETVLRETYIVMAVPISIASFVIVPWAGLVVAAVVICGTLAFGSPPINYLAIFSLGTVAVLVYLFARTLERSSRDSRHMAIHDVLTGLPNRALFVDRLQHALDISERDGSICAVLFMDLDQFKVVNDSLGHELGDELLVEVARRLRKCLRPEDTAARLGGDEFTVLLESIGDVRDAVYVAERIAGELETHVELRGQRAFVSTCVGIALSGNPGSRPDSLLRDADMAMYHAKKEGRGHFKVFDPSMHAQALERLELENDLRRAIELGELRVHYQPVVLLKTGELAGVEALVRWKHPVRGLIGPEEFIPLAEETGLIDSLGQWVLRTSCKQACEWRRPYPAAGSLIMSVNLSVKQFQQKDLTMQLERILQETGLDPHYLQLEITESAVAEDVERTVKLLWALKGLKVRIAIDDFGTGYSSLHSLRSFPLDALKVDKAFVEGLGQSSRDAAIAQMIIDLAHAVGMEAIGEGVETAEQIARLREMKCDAAQGYYFSEPLTGEEMGTLLDDAPSRLAGASLKGGRFTASGH